MVGTVGNISEGVNKLPLDLPEFSEGFVLNVGSMMHALEAIGLILVIWLGMQIYYYFMERKKLKTLRTIKLDVKNLEEKILSLEKIIKNKKK